VANDDSRDPSMSRRKAIGLGAASLGALRMSTVYSGPAVAANPTRSDAQVRTPEGSTTRAASNLTPGLAYSTLCMWDFFPDGPGVDRLIDSGVHPSLLPRRLNARIPLPVGAVLREFSVWAENGSTKAFDVNLSYVAVDEPLAGGAGSVTVPSGSVVAPDQSHSTALDGRIVTAKEVFIVGTDELVAYEQSIWSVRVGYVPPPTFVAISPARVYDSRVAAYSNSGLLAPNSNRVISVKDGRNNAGVIVTPDAVPVGATAVSFNLTATGSTGVNFLSVAPGDTSAVSTSTINFPGGDDRANGGIVKLSSNREIKVFNGDRTGSTHFIVDITGYTF
jgi:hypothetical protein